MDSNFDINNPTTYPPELYQQLVNSGGDINALKTRFANQQQMAGTIRSMTNPTDAAGNPLPPPSFRNSVGSTTITSPGAGSGVVKVLGNAASGYLQGQSMRSAAQIADAQTSQNQAVLNALLQQRAANGPSYNATGLPTDAAGALQFDQ